MQNCKKVLGLEIVPQAIHDAKENAKMNNIENTEFFIGKAEDLLSSVFYRAENEQVVAVVDPPRAGLRMNLYIIFFTLKLIVKLQMQKQLRN